MQITMTFDSVEDFLRYVDLRGEAATAFSAARGAEASDQPAADAVTAEEDAAGAAPEGAPPEAAPEPKKKAAKKPAAAQEEDPEGLRPMARELLGRLNEQTGSNTARGLIEMLGAKNLRLLPADKLPELIRMAKEGLADAV